MRFPPRSAHGEFEPHANRPTVVEFLEKSSTGRVEELIPVRYYRMSQSAFAFYRGAANIMAYDLAAQGATTGLRVQLGGDAHISNFGIFATAERNLIFDVNDFDETLPGPWEWDVKRMAASVHIGARALGISEKRASASVAVAVAGYRQHMQKLAAMTALDIWYSRIDASTVKDLVDVVVHHSQIVNGKLQIVDDPPKIFHPVNEDEKTKHVESVIERYRASLRDDIAVLFSHYELKDVAVKVVGVGSVGTRCSIALFAANDSDRLVLQVKEANVSVLEEFCEPSTYPEHGERVVAGQRLMQSGSDLFLGWTHSDEGHQFYMRQLNDNKGSIDVTKLDANDFDRYGSLCGQALALAHARSGDAKAIAEYLGTGPNFDQALAAFAARYADQNDRDYATFMEATKSGRLPTKQG